MSFEDKAFGAWNWLPSIS